MHHNESSKVEIMTSLVIKESDVDGSQARQDALVFLVLLMCIIVQTAYKCLFNKNVLKRVYLRCIVLSSSLDL